MVDLLVVVAIIALLLGIMLPALGRSRAHTKQVKDSLQISNVHKGLLAWAGNNAEQFPMPSELDKASTTVAWAPGVVKDTTRNIASILINYGYISAKDCVSPAEANSNIRAERRYQFQSPVGAADPGKALWDPGFRATPDDLPVGDNAYGDPGGWSYGLMPPIGSRRAKWAQTFRTTDAIVGNRGPAYTPQGAGSVLVWVLDANSNSNSGTVGVGVGSKTLLIHGSRQRWEGNIAYNDGRVTFEQDPAPETSSFGFSGLPAGQRGLRDNLFVNEHDTTRIVDSPRCTVGPPGTAGWNTNNYLRAWNGGVQLYHPNQPSPLTEIQPWFD